MKIRKLVSSSLTYADVSNAFSVLSEIVHPGNNLRYTLFVGHGRVAFGSMFLRFGIDVVECDESLGPSWLVVASVVEKDSKITPVAAVMNIGC